MNFTIKQGRFEGPYHKLLEMIESRKLSINEISLAQIADEYIAYIKTLKQNNSNNIDKNSLIDTQQESEKDVNDNKDDVSQFIVVASTLILVKAKSLLPSIEYSKEEKEEINNLEYKLLLYKVMIDGARQIKNIWHKSKYARAKSKITNVVFAPGNVKNITLQSISILTIVKLPHIERLRNVAVQQAVKIEHVIEGILNHMQNIYSKFFLSNKHEHSHKEEYIFTFKDVANHINDKYTILKNKINMNDKKSYTIVSFLAILDMIRNGIVTAENKEKDIHISFNKYKKSVDNA